MIDYFAANLWQAWALLCIVCLILELTSGDFFIICFSIGAFAAGCCSPFTGWVAQILIFAVTSVLCLAFLRPLMLKRIKTKEERVSNADAIIGRIGRVSETIVEGGHGRVAIDGDDWKALSHDGAEIAKGEPVEVVSIESIIITVRPKPKTENIQ